MLSKADDRLTRLFGDKSFFHGRVALERTRMFLVRGQRELASESLSRFLNFENRGSYPSHSGLYSKMTELKRAVNDGR